MLSDNLKKLRKSKGLSQEELAIRLNVVRQTISKWEQGLSVPDSEILVKIAEELDTSVSALLGETVVADDEPELKTIAEKLEMLNEQFAKRNRKRRRLWRVVFLTMGVFAVISLLQALVVFIYLQTITNDLNASTSSIGGADGPTSILVSRISVKYDSVFLAAILGIVSIIGLLNTKNK